VAVFTFIRRIQAVLEADNGPFHQVTLTVADFHLIPADIRHVPFFQEHKAVSNRQQSQLVGSDKVLTDSGTHNQRTAFPAHHHMVRLIRMHHSQGIGSTEALDGRFN